MISFLTKMINSFGEKNLRQLRKHLKKMTPNSDLQFIHKELCNSMTTARLLPHWRQSKLNLILTMKMNFSQKHLICALGKHFRRYAHALRFAVGLHGTQKFRSIVKYKHYQISSGAPASLHLLCQYTLM